MFAQKDSQQFPRSRPQDLLCFDFDGTLVDRESEPGFDPRLADCLRDLSERGARWVINTGRSLMHVLEGLAHYQVPLTPDYIVAREHEIFVRDLAEAWIDFGEWNANCRRRHDSFFREHRPFLDELRDFLSQSQSGAWLEEQGDAAGLIAHSETAMVEIIAFVEQRRARFPELGYQRNSIYLRFTHRDFDKGSALRELASKLGVPAASIFAAGDNHNDLSMLRHEIAHRLCCPSNALDLVKQQVLEQGGFVAKSPASTGMIEGLEHYFDLARPAKQRPA
ncbi:MAG: HAD-IIB family hydrolase [Verrucomicrobiales bacterium]